MDPIVSIFGVCDTEADDKVSMKEIQGNTDCWNMLENAGMQNTSITDEFSMIDKDQDGYVSMAEAYDAAKTLDRKGGNNKHFKTKKCHKNFGGTYKDGKSPRYCTKCMRHWRCQHARNEGFVVTCDCKYGECRVWRDMKIIGLNFKGVCKKTP